MSHPEPQPQGPIDSSRTPRYAGIATFARLPQAYQVDHADIAVVGAPFDTGVSYRPGARFGPAHIREASRLLRPYNPAQDISPFATLQVVDGGDLDINPFDIAETISLIEQQASGYAAQGTRLVTLGGDHTIALPLLRAVAEKHGPISVIHFDAHLDTWDTYFGEAYTHGTPFRRASEEGLIDHESSLHIGTRGPLYGPEDLAEDARLGFGIITSIDLQDHGLSAAIARTLARVAGRPIYVSVDVDVLDPAHAPGTGTPEAGGLTSRELLGLIRGLAGEQIVGADVVEVSPAYDHAQLTGVAASHIAYEIISVMAKASERATPASPAT